MSKPFIILVDDETEFIDTISKRLQKRGLKVLEANSGGEAMDIIEENQKIEVMILDVKMPGMNGLEVLKEMKKQYPLIEVVMLTGHATIESAIEGMKLGAFDYLMKPCEMDQLLEKVEAAAEKKRLHEEKIQNARIEKIILSRGV